MLRWGWRTSALLAGGVAAGLTLIIWQAGIAYIPSLAAVPLIGLTLRVLLEEALKALLPAGAALATAAPTLSLRDAFVLGALVGTGFAVTEATVAYGMNGLGGNHPLRWAIDRSNVLLVHLVATGLVATGLVRKVEASIRERAVVVGAGVGVHLVHNLIGEVLVVLPTGYLAAFGLWLIVRDRAR